MREEALTNDRCYHVLTRSIAGFKIFSSPANCKRFIETIAFYQHKPTGMRLSRFLESSPKIQQYYLMGKDKRVAIVSYCLMPTHVHLVLKQLDDDGILLFMKNCLESFSKYFNIKYKRNGPLWESRFKSIAIKSDEQLLHLTRYVHLNPVSAGIIEKPEDWKYSSYNDYILWDNSAGSLCDWSSLLEIKPNQYKDFVEERIGYQKQISKIKKLIIDGYSG